jgi:hypothetical protein
MNLTIQDNKGDSIELGENEENSLVFNTIS